MKEYIITIIGATLLSAMAGIIAPEKWRSYVQVITGLVIISCIISPVTAIVKSDVCDGFDSVQENIADSSNMQTELVIEELKKLAVAKRPIFGICLGHQLLAIARGAKTGKMKYGHRGANQPVKDLETGRIYISSQNHGYEVLRESLPAGAEETFINVNDGTCEGITYRDIPAFTVQFHPEACAGPKDTEELFGRFIKMMEKYKEEASCR